MGQTKKLYVMISKTDTGIGKVIRSVSKYPYNHVSLTLEGSFRTWVSFARYIQDTPLYGGFIVEPVERFLAKGERIDVRIFAIDLPDSHYARLEKLFTLAGDRDCGLMYNYFGLVAAAIGGDVPIPGAYTCLGFANQVLGTDYKNIQLLDESLSPQLFFDGPLSDLAPDSGNREDIYFTKLGPLRGLTYSIRTLANLTRRALNPKAADPVTARLR